MKPVDITIAVHNPIQSDARVRKEARTLGENGFDIALFGYGAPHKSDQHLDGLPVLLVDKIPITNPLNLLRWLVLTPESYSKRKTDFFPIILGMIFNMFFSLLAFGVPALILIPSLFDAAANSNVILGVVIFLPCITLALMQERSDSAHLFWAQTAFSTFAYALSAFVLFHIYISAYLVAGAIVLLGLGLILARYFKQSIFKFIQTAKVNYGMRVGYELVAYKLSKAIRRRSPKIIHAHDIIALIAAIKVKKAQPQTIVIWDAHELYTELAYKTANANAYIDRIIKKSAPYISHFITINESIASIYKERYPNLPKAVILMNATNQTNQEKITSYRLRDAAAVDKEQRILLFQGGFSPGRGIRIMLEAATSLPKEWTMVFMGSGLLEPEISEAAQLLNQVRPKNKPAIAMIPSAPYEELVFWTAGADLGIIPYENNSLNHLYCTPNKLWEYPNAGVPILASGLVEMDRFIKDHDIGLCMPMDFTAHDLNSCIVDYDFKMQKHFTQQCITFNKIENWAKYAELLLHIYRRISK